MKILFSFLLFFSSFVVHAETFQATVLSIHDGDTVTVTLANGKRSKVRLLGTDSPEVDFNKNTQGPAAFAARDVLISLLPIGSEILIVTDETVADKHDRLLGVIVYQNIDINQEMLRQGWSAFYLIAPFNKSLAKKYSQASKEAYQNQQGIFSEKHADVLMPYQFRLKHTGNKGRNLIGNVETKELFAPADLEKVPVYSRVFFPSEEMALARGYNW